MYGQVKSILIKNFSDRPTYDQFKYYILFNTVYELALTKIFIRLRIIVHKLDTIVQILVSFNFAHAGITKERHNKLRENVIAFLIQHEI